MAKITSNVVRLPTAANCIVRQRSIRAVRAFRKENPWPGEYKFPYFREQEAREAAPNPLGHIKRTPAMVIAMALFGMADEPQRRSALAVAELLHWAQPGEASEDALSLMRAVANLKEAAVGLVNVDHQSNL